MTSGKYLQSRYALTGGIMAAAMLFSDTFITMSYLATKIRNVSEISTYFVGILRLLRYFC